MPGVILVNPQSGRDETAPEEVAAAFPSGSLVRELAGDSVEDQVRSAIEAAGDPEFVAIAGGDGTIRSAASVLSGTALPLIAIPAGTRNHFAKELGVATIEAAGQAAAGDRLEIDLGEVNGSVFLNNAGIGIYPRIVRGTAVREKRWPKRIATLASALAQVRTLRKFNVTLDGESYRAWMVFVGNGRYGRSIFDVGVRDSLDDGLLDVRILRAEGRFARLRVVAALVLGRVERSPMAVFDEAADVELALDRERVDVALDGEVVSMSTPLRFRCLPKALTVLVPTTGISRK